MSIVFGSKRCPNCWIYVPPRMTDTVKVTWRRSLKMTSQRQIGAPSPRRRQMTSDEVRPERCHRGFGRLQNPKFGAREWQEGHRRSYMKSAIYIFHLLIYGANNDARPTQTATEFSSQAGGKENDGPLLQGLCAMRGEVIEPRIQRLSPLGRWSKQTVRVRFSKARSSGQATFA